MFILVSRSHQNCHQQSDFTLIYTIRTNFHKFGKGRQGHIKIRCLMHDLWGAIYVERAKSDAGIAAVRDSIAIDVGGERETTDSQHPQPAGFKLKAVRCQRRDADVIFEFAVHGFSPFCVASIVYLSLITKF